jgi:hypothetical protein
LTHFVWPSDWGWYAELIERVTWARRNNSCQNRLVKIGVTDQYDYTRLSKKIFHRGK